MSTAPRVSGRLSDKPVAENGWGYDVTALLHYHDDGPIGRAIRSLGADARIDVDGEPLANVLGLVATHVVRGEWTAQQGVDECKAVRDRLPTSSQAWALLDRAIDSMDALQTPDPALPTDTPEPLQDLVCALNAIPLVRRQPAKELTPLLAIIDDFAAGEIHGRRLIREVERLGDKRHESLGCCGKFEIDRALSTAVDKLNKLPAEALTRS